MKATFPPLPPAAALAMWAGYQNHALRCNQESVPARTASEWPAHNDLNHSLDMLLQARRAVRVCYLIDPDIDAEDLAVRQADYDAALKKAMEIILSNVQNQAATTILALAHAPHGGETTAHLDAVIDDLVARLVPLVAQRIAEGQ